MDGLAGIRVWLATVGNGSGLDAVFGWMLVIHADYRMELDEQ
jgi:hypothetical protein